MMEALTTVDRADRIAGCLLAGAVGDALGAGIEFDSLPRLRRRHGPAGVTGYVRTYGRLGAITDDTQMTLFTAEGLVRAGPDAPVAEVVDAIGDAYRRWLHTQGDPIDAALLDGWLVGERFLHTQRAPGNTCLAGLRGRRPGTPEAPANHSKGCGGVMRVAPVGLVRGDDAFEVAARAAALTHGHPTGYLAAGAIAVVVREAAAGRTIADGIEVAIDETRAWPSHDETVAALVAGRDVGIDAGAGPPSPERIEADLGAGWVADEALAIALACAVGVTDAAGSRAALLAAVNHSGDSDSTGAVTGNLLGARFGRAAAPDDLVEPLEGRETIERIAGELAGIV